MIDEVLNGATTQGGSGAYSRCLVSHREDVPEVDGAKGHHANGAGQLNFVNLKQREHVANYLTTMYHTQTEHQVAQPLGPPEQKSDNK